MKHIIVCGLISLVSMNALASEAQSNNKVALFEISERVTKKEFDVSLTDKGKPCIFVPGIYLDRTQRRRVLSAHDCKKLNELLTENPLVRIDELKDGQKVSYKVSYIVLGVNFGLNSYKTDEAAGRRAEYLANLRMTPVVREKIKEESGESIID